ncbi:dephospho-CoA kinase [Flavobacterium wongokense]|uniref:dephospho-CoA kinase n=1 Tax=Flavobacterium wongokense TaxID=2910674 RepID=UPI001EECA21A|nr:dephospho-CoA kinase [Flavobacterium sp. WG47]MCF6132081.1 dephospho-CoA kinase [Flavobacterium sp. WG47]
MTKIIGLTGGIGSGKTLVAKHIESLGIPVYIADDEAKKITETKVVTDLIIDAFGSQILENGKLNREKLAQLVFNNPEKLQKLNSIIHPKVKQHFDDWVAQHKNHPLVVKEAAILFESGSYKDCDAIITVTAPIETRLQRVIERDKSTREAVLKRMQSQWTDEQRVAKSNYVIHNISVKETYIQIEEILKLLTNQ